jgi:peptide/nickel transport system ATP-binding protein
MIAGPVLRIAKLSVALPARCDREFAVREVSLEVRRGEIVCLVGESGSGKSILALAVMGLLPRGFPGATGSASLEGEDLIRATDGRRRSLRGQKMTMIFQEPATALNPVMTCGGQIDELLVQHTSLSAPQRAFRIVEMLESVRLPEPSHIAAAYPHQLSGGQRQRIMIAMALILKPALLIADEPTTALDVTTQAEILSLIRDLQRRHDTAVLFITHDFGVVADIADEVAVLRGGELLETGATGKLLSRPRHPYTRMLLDSVPTLTPRKGPVDPARPVHLRTRGLTKVFETGGLFRKTRRVAAATSVDIEVRRGETLGIVGESGSGKSTVARMIAHLIEASSVVVELDGASDLRGGARRQFHRKVQVVFQDPYRSLNPRRTVGAAISEGPRNFGASRAAARERASELMDLVKLSPAALSRYPHEFSGGQRQRICIARALALEPEVLIADEAVSALDVSVQARILDLLEEIQQRLRLTMLFITHDLRVAARMCNRVIVMQRGRIVEEGPVAELFRSPQQDYTRSLLSAAPGRRFHFGTVQGVTPQ